MVLKPEPIGYALEAVLDADLLAEQKATGDTQIPVLLMSPAGRRFDQHIAQSLGRFDRIALICGRYEAVDERVSDLFVTDELSLGDFVLSGGEIPAMAIVEAVTRLIPGVLGDMRALVQDSFSSGLLEHPQYTRPPEFRGQAVPEVLLSGDHARVERWRRERSLERTWRRRPDLLSSVDLSTSDRSWLGIVEGRAIVNALDSPE